MARIAKCRCLKVFVFTIILATTYFIRLQFNLPVEKQMHEQLVSSDSWEESITFMDSEPTLRAIFGYGNERTYTVENESVYLPSHMHSKSRNITQTNDSVLVSHEEEVKNLNTKDMKYILLKITILDNHTQLHQLKEGQEYFIENKCKHLNCYLTRNISFFNDTKLFDAVVFGIPKSTFPEEMPRSPNQKYIFATKESAVLYPAIDDKHDKFYNLTWTYKLDSDILWRNFIVYDDKDNVIGPAQHVKWLKEMNRTTDAMNTRLKSKTKAVARIVSKIEGNCRDDYLNNLTAELQHFDWAIDTFVTKGDHSDSSRIDKILGSQYYFYLAFENIIDDDYVTDDVLNALKNFAVPVVRGGADYNRFLPPGSYLNANKMTPKILANEIKDIISNTTRYQDFFRWRNHYRIETSETEVCNLCTAINDENVMSKISTYKKFRKWWNGAKRQSVIDFLVLVFSVDETVRNLAINHDLSPSHQKKLIDTIKRRVDVPSFESFLNQNIRGQTN